MANCGSKNTGKLSFVYLNKLPHLDTPIKHNSQSTQVLSALAYFDFFKYPLNKEQIFHFSRAQFANLDELEMVLQVMVQSQKIYSQGNFFALRDIDEYVRARDAGELRFKNLQSRIEKTSQRLSYFPFVKFVGLSGSLSKGYASPNADIDLFIVTQKDRLWICRTILHLFKKISFLKGSQHWYCMNYFVDETAMIIEEQNYFTAIELSTLKPLVDEGGYYLQLMNHNIKWINSELPNFKFQKPGFISPTKGSLLSKLIAILCFDSLNLWLMKITDSKWRRKWKRKNYPSEDYNLAFKTRINISKNHIHNYQKKLLEYLTTLKINQE